MDPSHDDDGDGMSRQLADLGLGQPFVGGPHFNALDEPPPPPRISSEGVVAVDITQKFLSAASSLEPGELVKDGYFTLFESVGALEVMDPKMDSGCLAPGETLDEGYDVTRPLLPSEVVGIIDQLLSLEMAWHLGYPLSQSLFTSVYIERMLQLAPTTVQEADFIKGRSSDAPRDPMLGALRAYCLGLLKSCSFVNQRIKGEHYYEEEDFVTNTYHRSLLDNLDIYEVRDEIMAARKVIHDLRSTLTEEMAHALGFRLELRTAFLRAIELSQLRSNPDSLSLPWSHMQEVWETINKTRHLGKSVPEAFSTKIQRRLASTMPPRPIVQPSPEETYKHFKKLIADGANVPKVLNYVDSQTLLTFVMTFQAQKPQPLVYIRALLQNFLFQDMVVLGRLSIRQILDNDLCTIVLPCSILLDPSNDDVESPHHPRYAIAHQMELFRQRAAQSYLDIFRTFCQNRCRVRRTLYHMLQDWETVQLDAEEVDQLLQAQIEEKPVIYPPSTGVPSYSLPLSSWAYHYKLRLMQWTVQLGFELDIYQPDELAGMYWYLGYLAKCHVQHAERIKFFIKHRVEADANNKINNINNKTAAQYTRCKSYLYLTVLEAAITTELAEALTNLYAALSRLGLIVPPPRPYSTDALRYEVRMKPFAPIGLPELPSFEVFRRHVTQPNTPTAELLETAAKAAADAKGGLEAVAKMGESEAFAVGCHDRWLRSIKDWTKAAIAAGVAIGTVKRAVANGRVKGLKVEVQPSEKGYHPWWVVPKVKEQR